MFRSKLKVLWVLVSEKWRRFDMAEYFNHEHYPDPTAYSLMKIRVKGMIAIVLSCQKQFKQYLILFYPRTLEKELRIYYQQEECPQKVRKVYLGKICSMPYSNAPMTDSRRSFVNWLKGTETMNF